MTTHKSTRRHVGLVVIGLMSFGFFPSSVQAQAQDQAKESVLVACAEASPWCKTFFFGVQFLPDYEESEGGSLSGLNQQTFFGHFNFDAVKENVVDDQSEFLDNFGFNISLFESGSIADDQTASVPSSFNQISGTVSLEGYYSLNLWGSKIPPADIKLPTKGSRYGFRFIAGSITRDDALESEDTLSTYASIGFNYQFYDSLPSLTKNSVAAGEFYLGLAHFENWAGADQKLSNFDEDGRVIFRGSYNIGGEWFMGIYANGGRGPDDVSVFFGTRKTTDELLSFIGLKR